MTAFSANIHELTEQQIEKLAAKLPLPEFSESDMLYHAEEFVKTRARGFACALLGHSIGSIGRRAFLEYIKVKKESIRFHKWLTDHNATFDNQRGKYLAWI